jgi:hypothetical protein
LSPIQILAQATLGYPTATIPEYGLDDHMVIASGSHPAIKVLERSVLNR